MSVLKKLQGVIGSLFRIGVSGPQLKNNAGVLEIRNSDDSDYAPLRVGTPLDDDQVVSRAYLDGRSSTFVFRPADPDPASNVFTNWTDLMAAIAKGTGVRILVIDDDLAPTVVDAGTWDMYGVVLEGATKRAGNNILEVPTGALLQNVSFINKGLVIQSTSNSHIIEYTMLNGQPSLLTLERGGSLQNNGTAPAIVASAGGMILILAYAANLLQGTDSVLEIPLGVTSQVIGLDIAIMESDVFSGAGDLIVVNTSGAINFTGNLIVFPSTDAKSLGYSPNNPADWSGNGPTNIGDALDRLAASLGPIP